MPLEYGNTGTRRGVQVRKAAVIACVILVVLGTALSARLWALKRGTRTFIRWEEAMEQLQRAAQAMIREGGPGVTENRREAPFVNSFDAFDAYVRSKAGPVGPKSVSNPFPGVLLEEYRYEWLTGAATHHGDYLVWTADPYEVSGGSSWYLALRCDGVLDFLKEKPGEPKSGTIGPMKK